MSEQNYSVLMSVYAKENPEYLRESMESIARQTLSSNDFVLVCDGPLTSDLDNVIEKMQKKFGNSLQVVRLKTNTGLGTALNEGMQHCKNELVARMDSDDISRDDRCEKQLEVFKQHPELSIVSGIVEEFSDSIDHVDSRRVPPETNAEIVEFAKRRNPFNHPCVMYKKSAVEAAGGYQDFYLLEDYYLWVRMLSDGFQGYNIQEPLLWMRAGSAMFKRRSGWKYAKSQKALFNYMKKKGIISRSSYVKSVIIRGGASIVPNWLRQAVFLKQMRR